MYIMSLKSSSPQALGRKLKKRFSKFLFFCQNAANTLGFDPCLVPTNQLWSSSLTAHIMPKPPESQPKTLLSLMPKPV